jgi:hypothetical protein
VLIDQLCEMNYNLIMNEFYQKNSKDLWVDGVIQDCIIKELYQIALKDLWADDGIQECFGRRREFQLIDSAK